MILAIKKIFYNNKFLEDPNAPDRCAVIQGSIEQIERATQMISELVTRSAQAGGPTETFYMPVPANKTGLVIGKNGDTIKQVFIFINLKKNFKKKF